MTNNRFIYLGRAVRSDGRAGNNDSVGSGMFFKSTNKIWTVQKIRKTQLF